MATWMNEDELDDDVDRVGKSAKCASRWPSCVAWELNLCLSMHSLCKWVVGLFIYLPQMTCLHYLHSLYYNMLCSWIYVDDVERYHLKPCSLRAFQVGQHRQEHALGKGGKGHGRLQCSLECGFMSFKWIQNPAMRRHQWISLGRLKMGKFQRRRDGPVHEEAAFGVYRS